MNINKTQLIKVVNVTLLYHQNGNDCKMKESIRYFVLHYWDFNLVTEYFLTYPNITWNELKSLGNFFSLIYDYSEDEPLTRTNLIDYATKCFSKSFLLCPMSERHGIVHDFNNLVGKTYKQYIDK